MVLILICWIIRYLPIRIQTVLLSYWVIDSRDRGQEEKFKFKFNYWSWWVWHIHLKMYGLVSQRRNNHYRNLGHLCHSILSTLFKKKKKIYLFVYLNNLYTPCGAQPHNPRIQSPMLYRLSQMGVPVSYTSSYLIFSPIPCSRC